MQWELHGCSECAIPPQAGQVLPALSLLEGHARRGRRSICTSCFSRIRCQGKRATAGWSKGHQPAQTGIQPVSTYPSVQKIRGNYADTCDVSSRSVRELPSNSRVEQLVVRPQGSVARALMARDEAPLKPQPAVCTGPGQGLICVRGRGIRCRNAATDT